MEQDTVRNAVLSELVRVAGAHLGVEAASRPTHGQVESDGFIVAIGTRGGPDRLQIFVARPGAAAFTAAVHGGDADDAAIADTLRALCVEAIATCDPATFPIEPSVLGVSATATFTTTGPITELVFDTHDFTLRVALQPAVAAQVAAPAAAGRPQGSGTLDVLMDIELPLVVRFGRTELPLKALTALGPGSMIDLGRLPDEPVEVLISNRVVARGDVVIVSGNYGVRISEVVSPAARSRSMGVSL